MRGSLVLDIISSRQPVMVVTMIRCPGSGEFVLQNSF